MEPRKIEYADLFINDSTVRKQYVSRKGDEKPVIHWGQRKLFLTELLFFSVNWDGETEITVVYAGSAPGDHIEYLSQVLGPKVTFILYDPAVTRVRLNENIILGTGKFTDETARIYANRDNVYFLSDIRVSVHHKIKGTKKQRESMHETDIKNEMEMQQRWVTIMRPLHAYLKCRFPYPDKIIGGGKTMTYVDGTIFFQPWAGKTSTEGRIYIPRPPEGQDYPKIKYSLKDYEECFFNFNINREIQGFYVNIFTPDEDIDNDHPELTRDIDSTFEFYIFVCYLTNILREDPTSERVQTLSRGLTDSLNSYFDIDNSGRSIAQRHDDRGSNEIFRAHNLDWYRTNRITTSQLSKIRSLRAKGDKASKLEEEYILRHWYRNQGNEELYQEIISRKNVFYDSD